MPGFDDILNVADLLQIRTIAADEFRCVAVRNRNSRCKKCENACINGAIKVANNELTIDFSACVNCGCCVAACPTSALSALEPHATDVMMSARQAAFSAVQSGDATLSMIVIACARKASKHEVPSDLFAEVPCLGHVCEVNLVELAASGFDDVVLVDGNCATCKYGASTTRIDATVDEAMKFLEAAANLAESAPALITRVSEFPPELVKIAEAEGGRLANVRGEDRRGIFRQTGSYVKAIAENVAQKKLDERMGRPEREPMTLHARLSAGKRGNLPTFEPFANYSLLENMSEIARRETSDLDMQACKETIDSRHFGNVKIDPEKCSGCGMCVMFCPTDALKYAQFAEPENEKMRYIEFQAADCVQCMLCKDVCLRYCLDLESRVEVAELYDFEPRLIEISRPQSTTSIADLRRRNKK